MASSINLVLITIRSTCKNSIEGRLEEEKGHLAPAMQHVDCI